MLNRNMYFVREHVGLLKLVDTYDILDPESQEQIGIAKEEPPAWAKYLRLLISKRLLPTIVNIYEDENQPPLFSIRKPAALFRAKVTVNDRSGVLVGHFKSKMFAIRGGFFVFDSQDRQVAEIKGDWKGWNFKFLDNSGREIGTVTKKWAGIGKELFTSADNYIISINESGEHQEAVNMLLIAAGLAIDIVYKEKK